MRKVIKKIWTPETYHGFDKTTNFFEGWFFKLVDSERKNILAVIPGIFKNLDKSKEHAFIQILDGITHESYYLKYDSSEFNSAIDKFEINIGRNSFSSNKINLNIDSEIKLVGELKFEQLTKWPKTILSPGIMGWYSYVPFMECNHGIISLDHKINGILNYNGKKINYNEGKGYSEKDWGSSFPSAYVWLQSNHFSEDKVSFTSSIAKIPWLFSSFRGFIIGLYYKGNLFRLATYTGAELNHLKVKDDFIEFSVEDKNLLLEVTAERKESGMLHGPYENMMSERITESLSSEISIRLIDKENGKVIMSDRGLCAGLDVNGKLEEIVY